MKPARIRRILLLSLSCSMVPWLARAAGESKIPKGPFEGLEYRSIGPAAGGRVARVTGVPGDPLTYWAATAAGGVWKSTNGGDAWQPVFDDQPVSSIGSIAVAPSDPNVVYVGSGEGNIRGNVGEGNGIYRSRDAGKTWTHVWESEGQIGALIVHPSEPDVAFAAVLGSPFGPGENRGVFRTLDGGDTWTKVLYVDENTGASDVCFTPSNPRILFAGTWQTRRTPWSLTSGGPGGGLWTSRDAGSTWMRLQGKGLPDGPWGKVGCGVARTDGNRVYALIEADEGGLFRSDDGGESWTRVQASRGVRQRAWYYSTLTVDPTRADVVWFPQVSMLKTVDGGRTLAPVKGGGWDYHDVWIDPADARRMIVGSDAGVSISRDGGITWVRPAIPISQLYHVSVDSRVPYRVLASLQDQGTASGPSRTLHGGGILLSDWVPVGGGEAGHVVADPSDPDIVWAGEYLGFISRWDGRTRRVSHVGSYPENGSGHGSGDLEVRFQWTAPIVISSHDPSVVYHAGNRLFRTTDGGQTWSAISPDLTRNDASKQRWSGGPIAGDNTGVEFYGTIFAMAESPVTPGVLWTGSDDGLVHVSRDGGATWTNVTPREFPEWATVAGIEPSRLDAGAAYLVADRHRLDDESPYLWKTADYGRTWKRLGRDLDPEVYLKVVRQDPVVPGLLYLGTERGVAVSHDDGASWQSLRLNLPTVAVPDLAVTEHDLVVGTLGRSIWILDDLGPIRAGLPAREGTTAALIAPPPTIAWFVPGRWAGPYGSDAGAGENPPRGAAFRYWLEQEPAGEIRVEIVDGGGTVIRTLSSEPEPRYVAADHPDADPDEKHEPELTRKAGWNRAAWDLQYEKSRWIPGHVSESGPVDGPVALPGTYTLRLLVGDTAIERPIEVVPDPREAIPPEASRAQFEFVLALRDDVNRVVDRIETIRSVRDQLERGAARLSAGNAHPDLVATAAAIVARLDPIERTLHSPDAEVGYDILAGRDGGAKLLSRYGWLAGGAHGHAGPPTQGQREVAATLRRVLEEQEAALAAVLDEVRALDDRAAQAGIPFVSVP